MMTVPGRNDDEWRRLCLKAFENLPADTKVTLNDVDAILTWCLPAPLLPGVQVIEGDAARVTALRILAGKHPGWDEVTLLAEAYEERTRDHG